MFLPQIIHKKYGNLIYILWLIAITTLTFYIGYGIINPPWFLAINCLVYATLIIVASLLSANIFKYFKPNFNTSYYPIIWNIILAFAVVFAQNYYVEFYNLQHLETYLLITFKIRLVFSFVVITAFSYIAYLWFIKADASKYQDFKNNQLQLAKDAELNNLRQQLQPHFLFNSLNSINALIGSNPQKARTMIENLSAFLRGTLNQNNKQFNKLNAELEHLKLYLQIEEVRFGHRLNIVFNLEPNCMEMQIPVLLLQPIVENAIKFGLYGKLDKVTINIMAKCLNQNLYLSVTNPFDVNNIPEQKGTGFGLSSIKRRLYLIFEQNNLLETKQENHIFTTNLTIPQL